PPAHYTAVHGRPDDARRDRLRAAGAPRLRAADRLRLARARPGSRALRHALPLVDGRSRWILARDGDTLALGEGVRSRARLAAALREVVPRRPAEHRGQLSRPSPRRTAAQQGGADLDRRARRAARAHLSRAPP